MLLCVSEALLIIVSHQVLRLSLIYIKLWYVWLWHFVQRCESGCLYVASLGCIDFRWIRQWGGGGLMDHVDCVVLREGPKLEDTHVGTPRFQVLGDSEWRVSLVSGLFGNVLCMVRLWIVVLRVLIKWVHNLFFWLSYLVLVDHVV